MLANPLLIETSPKLMPNHGNALPKMAITDKGEQTLTGPGGEGRLPPRGEDHAEHQGAEQGASQHDRRWAHVLHRQLDEEEARAPDQGEQGEGRIATTHRLLFGGRLGAVASQEV